MIDFNSMNPNMLELIIQAVQKTFDNMDFKGSAREAFNIGVAKGLSARIRINGHDYDDSWMKELKIMIEDKINGSK
jgi:hypothetical protein